ncbi:polysaccharide deacetylase family protein [Clostridium sp. DL1XJH146]
MKNKKKLILGLIIGALLIFTVGCQGTNAKQTENSNQNKSVDEENNTSSNKSEDVSETENTSAENANNVDDTKKSAGDSEEASDKTTEQEVSADEKIVYLTFDDGPSENVTPRVLKILDDYDVKATFFVMGLKAEKYPDLILEEHNNGHIVANHTYSHDLDYLYENPDNFMEDVLKCENVLKSIIDGYDYKLIRFPEGAFHDKKADHRERVESEGYHYIDWNCINGDYMGNSIPADELVQYVKDTYRDQQKVVLLMHDSTPKETTADALPEIIEFFQEKGYTFKNLEKLTH